MVLRGRPVTVESSLGDVFDVKSNSLNAIRLMLATAVIVSHSWPLGGFRADPAVGGLTVGQWAVAGFFAISGWLITGSRLSTTLGDYLRRRLLRIYPGYLACLLVVAFVFAPLAALVGPGHWPASDAVGYVWRNLPLQVSQLGIGDTLSSVPWEHMWNGSLWTLAYEFICYLLVAGLVAVSRRHLAALVAAVLVVCTIVQAGFLWGGLAVPSSVARGTMLAGFFFAGSLLYLMRGRVPAVGWVASAAAALLVVSALLEGPTVLGLLPVAYLCIWLGIRLPFRAVGRRNDISYGMYVYGFPVQQTLALLGVQHYGVAVYLLLSVVCTVPLAAASWYLVERPASRSKRLAQRRDPTSRTPALRRS